MTVKYELGFVAFAWRNLCLVDFNCLYFSLCMWVCPGFCKLKPKNNFLLEKLGFLQPWFSVIYVLLSDSVFVIGCTITQIDRLSRGVKLQKMLYIQQKQRRSTSVQDTVVTKSEINTNRDKKVSNHKQLVCQHLCHKNWTEPGCDQHSENFPLN